MRFISVTKPGIIFGNLIAVLGGYFLASPHPADFLYLLFTLLGISLVIASGCVFNNVIDRDIDRLMERTKNRVLAKDELSPAVALIYATLLGFAGFFVLNFYTNLLTVVVTAIGFVGYAGIYSLFIKRRSILSTPIGAIAGAVPPVAGYCAVTNNFDTGTILAFLILFFWQMPHFYAIAIYRIQDFKAAKLPVLPITKSIYYTQIMMLIYILVFTLVTLLPTFLGTMNYFYFCVALFLGLIWFILGLSTLKSQDNKIWARKMFLFSIINLTLLCMTIAGVSLY
ncbi:MAG TPA: heme o synthase [Gammaproteobacteria bacterium]|nr:heme o synthase [Gammaproteobacteria bacterium]